MNKKKNRAQRQARCRFRLAKRLIFTAALAGAILAAVAWWRFGADGETNNPEVVVNLTSMLGKDAPPFELRDSEGQSYAIRPGGGRKLILVFHMGSI